MQHRSQRISLLMYTRAVAATAVSPDYSCSFFTIQYDYIARMGDNAINNEFLRIFRNHLPQWRLKSAVYFITWDLLPRHEELTADERSFVVSTLLHFNQERYHIHAYAVMNDHIYVVVKPLGQNDISKILQGWKSYTANQLQRRFKRKGSIWQKDSYTHIIRDEEDFITKAEYVLTNPQRRWPDLQGYEWVAWLGCEEN